MVLEGFSVPSPQEGEVLVGVRPEDLRVAKEKTEGAFRARVLVVEPLQPEDGESPCLRADSPPSPLPSRKVHFAHMLYYPRGTQPYLEIHRH